MTSYKMFFMKALNNNQKYVLNNELWRWPTNIAATSTNLYVLVGLAYPNSYKTMAERD